MKRFDPGQLVFTPGAEEALDRNNQHIWTLVWRHIQGDYGDMDSEDKAQNERMISKKGMIMSSYKLADKTTVWLITDAGHTQTTFLLPSEY